MRGEVDPLEQLGTEARELEKDTSSEAPTGTAGQSAGHEHQAEGAAGAGAAPSPEAEVIPNPAPHIAAALSLMRDVPFLKAMIPPAVIGALDDAAIAELSGALGDVAVKYRWNFTPALGRWKEELRALMALGTIGAKVYQAMHGDGDAARAARARDVSPGAPGAHVDPPNPAAGQKPVEPGG